jgi:hypothetical protein
VTKRHFLHCRDCDAVFRPSPHDSAPEYYMTPEGITEIIRDDYTAFLTHHARHALETLRSSGDATAHEGSLWDPMAVTYWQVTNGRDSFLVRGWREHTGERRRYQLVPGRLVVEPYGVEVPETEIAAEIDRALYPGTLPSRKLAAFVAHFRTLVGEIDPSTLTLVYDVSSDPTLSVAKLPAWALDRLAANARQIFDTADAARIEAHLNASADEPDAFTVLVRRRVRVEQSA